VLLNINWLATVQRIGDLPKCLHRNICVIFRTFSRAKWRNIFTKL